MPTQNPSSPTRREFFRRAGTATAAVAVAVTPLSLFAQKPKVWEEKDGVHVSGDNVTLWNVEINRPVHIKAQGTVCLNTVNINSTEGPAIFVNTLGA